MKYKEKKFEEIYENLINIYGNKLEEARQLAISQKRNNKHIILKTILIGIIAIIVNLYLIFYVQKNVEILTIILMVVIYFVPVYTIKTAFKNNKEKEYYKLFKKDVINYLIGFFYDNFTYKPAGKKEDNLLIRKNYITANFETSTTISSQDLITGFNKCQKFQIADISTYYESSYDNKYVEGFQGLFAVLDINKKLNTEIVIRSIKKSIFEKKYPKLETDSVEFQKVFDLYASNKISAMQLLTADVMTILVDFYNRIKRDFDIIIKDNHIYLRIVGVNIFEILDVKKSALDKENIYRNYLILEFIFELGNKLSKLIEETPL